MGIYYLIHYKSLDLLKLTILEKTKKYFKKDNNVSVKELEALGKLYLEKQFKYYEEYILNNHGPLIEEMKSKIHSKSTKSSNDERYVFKHIYGDTNVNLFDEEWSKVNEYTMFVCSDPNLGNKKIILTWLYALKQLHENLH